MSYNKKFAFPGPGAHSPSDKVIAPRVIGAPNQKGERDHTSYLCDSFYRGATSPRFYESKYGAIDPKVASPRMIKLVKEEKQPSFMVGPVATAKISPVTYNPLDSYVKTQVKRNSIIVLKGKKDVGGSIHQAL
jgi:hypothetical protein